MPHIDITVTINESRYGDYQLRGMSTLAIDIPEAVVDAMRWGDTIDAIVHEALNQYKRKLAEAASEEE